MVIFSSFFLFNDYDNGGARFYAPRFIANFNMKKCPWRPLSLSVLKNKTSRQSDNSGILNSKIHIDETDFNNTWYKH